MANVNGFVVRGVRGALEPDLVNGVSHVVALDTCVRLEFEDIY